MKNLLGLCKTILSFFIKSKEETVSDTKEQQTQQIKDLVPVVFANISDQDKIELLNIIRPIIKNFNSDSSYINFCNKLLENKILKTFATLSEDQKTLTITLTQNEIFNSKLADFIKDIVIKQFQEKINASLNGKYQIIAENGSILIHKIQE